MDQLNFTLSLSNDLSEQFRHLDPHKSAFDIDKPKTLSSNLAIPKSVIATISNWLHDEDSNDNYTDFMRSIATG